jgi:hypothetical protein
MGAILVGVAMLVISIWINGNWERIAESEKAKILKRSNRFVCFALFNLLPALPLAYCSAAVAMGIYAGIHNLADDAPITFRDGILFVAFSAVYCLGLYAFLPFPFGADDRPRIGARK